MEYKKKRELLHIHNLLAMELSLNAETRSELLVNGSLKVLQLFTKYFMLTVSSFFFHKFLARSMTERCFDGPQQC